MSVNFRTRNQTLLAKIQDAEDTEAAPTPANDAVRVMGLEFTPSLDEIDTSSEVTASLSAPAPVAGGGYAGMKFQAYMRGAGTVGAAPDWGPLVRPCGFSETLLAAAETGTAQAGDASSITLAAAGPSSTDDAYKGMVIEITGGTGAGQARVCSGYAGATKLASVFPDWDTAPDNTSDYSVHACALYRPVTDNLEWLTLWAYQHHNDSSKNSIRRRLMDGQGTFSLSLPPASRRDLPKFEFTFRGELPAVPDGVAHPGVPSYANVNAEAFRAADAYLGIGAIKISDFSIDLGATVDQFDDPAAELSYDSAQLVGRKPTGRMTLALQELTTRDAFSDWKSSTSRALWLNWGSAEGRRISIFCPALVYTGHQEADVRGFAGEQLPFQLTGLDSELWICVH